MRFNQHIENTLERISATYSPLFFILFIRYYYVYAARRGRRSTDFTNLIDSAREQSARAIEILGKQMKFAGVSNVFRVAHLVKTNSGKR